MTETQGKNLAWLLPRPKPDRYKGGMPLYAEKWLLVLARELIHKPDAAILNVFCGMNSEGFRVDIKDEVHPDICCDVHELSKHLNGQHFDIIFADPPYSNKEASELYGTPPLRYKKWASECDRVLNPGGLFIIYHKLLMPNPNPEHYLVVKRVFIGNRTLHAPRVAVFFQKK